MKIRVVLLDIFSAVALDVSSLVARGVGGGSHHSATVLPEGSVETCQLGQEDEIRVMCASTERGLGKPE